MVFICCKILSVISAFTIFISFVNSVQSVNVKNTNWSSNHPRVESEKLKHVRDYLKKINKPVVKTIQSPDGDLVDCVLFHQQPAFDHPLLKAQKPTGPPEMSKGPTSTNNTTEEKFQVWRMTGKSCPENTVPIRRVTEEDDVMRASSVHTFGRKPKVVRKESVNNKHEHAIVHVNWGIYKGVSAAMDVWGPTVENPTEFSSSHIYVMIGKPEDGEIHSIEAGWQVHPHMYHDQVPRLYVYWSHRSNLYQNTGCYNLLCPGFIQISSTIMPGGAITHVSPYNKMLYDLSFSIYKDSFDGNWWLEVKNVKVGYWPWQMFSSLRYEAAYMIQFGGEIINTGEFGNHTKTEMGNGQFPNEGYAYGQAACFRNITVYSSTDRDDPVVDLNLNTKSDNPKCYTTKLENYDTKLGYHFYYGGPGGAAKGCK